MLAPLGGPPEVGCAKLLTTYLFGPDSQQPRQTLIL
jgi:hypothetical protein